MESGHENRRTICQNILRRARAPKHRWLILSVKGTMGKNTIKSRMKCPYDTQACVWGPHDWCRRTLTRRGHYTRRTLDTRLTEEPLRLMKGPLRSLRVGFGQDWQRRGMESALWQKLISARLRLPFQPFCQLRPTSLGRKPPGAEKRGGQVCVTLATVGPVLAPLSAGECRGNAKR